MKIKKELLFLVQTATVVLALSFCGTASSQESLVPLSSRQGFESAKKQLHKSNEPLTLPFFDDFSDYEGLPDPERWNPSSAFVNSDYAPLPPTIGMTTLDALDGEGNLYPLASTSIFAADTLVSRPIRLDSLTGGVARQLQPSDSIYLSFFLLPGGWYGNPWERVGDAPSAEDSLFLDFYSPSDSSWITVWSTPGYSADTAGITALWPWKFVAVRIDDMRFFDKLFQFRFRNYASLDATPKTGIAGNCDQWNIDYIYLDYNRSRGDSLSRDIAFVDKAPSMLASYQAMPSRQFQPSDMADSLKITMVNRYNQTLAVEYSYKVLYEDGSELASYDGGLENIQPFFPSGHYQEMPIHSNPPVNFTFPTSTDFASYRIVHTLREGVSGDNHNGNDTIVFNQVFSNYYAYDDGIPENGYGLTTTGSHQWLALRYDLNVPDTLTAIDLYFNKTREGENENVNFKLCVWECNHGKPGELIYEDENRMQTAFNGMNRYQRYPLSNPIVIGDTVFVGFEQLSNVYINIGFDRNNNTRDRLYYRTSPQWQQSILSGSVMMRPVFGIAATAAIPTYEEKAISVFPNPTKETIYLSCEDCNPQTTTITIYDIRGKMVLCQPYSTTVNLSQLSAGLYLMHITDKEAGIHQSKKIIVK